MILFHNKKCNGFKNKNIMCINYLILLHNLINYKNNYVNKILKALMKSQLKTFG